MPRFRSRVGLLLLPLLIVLTACSAGPSQRPPVAYRDGEQQVAPAPRPPEPAPVPELGPPASDRLAWQDCAGATQEELGSPLDPALQVRCTQLLTDLDPPGSPTRGTAQLSLLSVGTGPVPLVVVNDAGGRPGTLFAAELATQLPPEMLATYRIIGMDRRGSGQSDPADCVPPADRSALVGFDPKATDRESLDRLLESVRSSSQECLLDLDDRLPAYDTWRTAADLEELRRELQVPKLHALGRGEGSRVLTTYSERYPATVGRMVLDGAPDPQLDARGRGEAQAQAAANSFDAFSTDCAARADCPLGPDPRRTVLDLVERTRTTPLETPDAQVTAGALVRGTVLGLSDRDRWPELANALAAADRGDGAPMARIVAPLSRGTDRFPPRIDAELITMCNDTTLRIPPERTADIAADWVEKFPLFGGMFAQHLVWCGQWPVPQQPLPSPRAPGLPPIPVVSTEHDPLVPALSSSHMAQQLPSGVVLNWLGAGHGGVGRSECVTAAISRFFVNGEVPPEGTACPA